MSKEIIIISIVLLSLLLLGIGWYIFSWHISSLDAVSLYENGEWVEAEERIKANQDKYSSLFPGKDKEFLMLAEISYKKGDYVLAEQYYHQTVNLNPATPLAYYRIGLLRNTKHRYRKAIDYFSLARSYTLSSGNDENLHEINNHLASVLFRYGLQYQMAGKDNTALEYFSQAIEIDPDFPEVLHAIGSIYYKNREYRSAWEKYEKALSLNMELSVLYRNVKTVLNRLGKENEALRYSEKYKEIEEIESLIIERQALSDGKSN